MKLTPERLEEIMHWIHDKYVCHTEMDTIAFKDLLAHIDTLEAENKRCQEIAERDGLDYSNILKERDRLKERVGKLREALKEFTLDHVHNESLDEYRPLSDSRGWCQICSTKVRLNEDIARDALEADELSKL